MKTKIKLFGEVFTYGLMILMVFLTPFFVIQTSDQRFFRYSGSDSFLGKSDIPVIDAKKHGAEVALESPVTPKFRKTVKLTSSKSGSLVSAEGGTTSVGFSN